MVGKARIHTVILIFLMLTSLALAGVIFNFLQQERSVNAKLQEDLNVVRKEYDITLTKLEESKRTVSSLEIKLKDYQAQINTLNGDLEQEKSAKLDALAEVEQLKTDLDKQKGVKRELEDKLAQAQNNLEKMQAQLTDLESKRTDLETKIKDLEAQAKEVQNKDVELGKIVVNPESEGSLPSVNAQEQRAPEATGLEGKVLVVNKEYNFVVINLGNSDGINTDDIFSVYHNHNYIGDIKVEKVHDSMSAAGFVSIETKDKISEGDRVVQKIK